MNHPFKVLDGTLDKYKTEKVLPGANKYFGMIEKILVNSDKGAFVLGTKMTVADTSIYEAVSWLLEIYGWEVNGPFTEVMSQGSAVVHLGELLPDVRLADGGLAGQMVVD